MDTLYRFRLNKETGKIDTFKITEYSVVGGVYSRKCYRYHGPSCTNFVDFKNIDKMFCNQVYTFNPDINAARQIMLDTLNDKADMLRKEYDTIRDILEKMEEEVTYE